MARPATGQVEWRTGKDGADAWHVRVTLAKDDRPWVAMPGIARDDELGALAKGKQVSARMRALGVVRKTAGETVSEWFKRWVKHRKASGISTTGDDVGRFKKWIEPTIGTKEIAKVATADIEAVVSVLDSAVLADAISWKTACNAWGIVTKMLDDAAHAKVATLLRVRDDNPAKDVRGPDRGIDRTKPFLRPDELVTLLSNEDVPMHRRHVYALGAYTAVRVSELRAIMPSDVSFETMQITVAKQRNAEGLRNRTKSKRARFVPIEPAILPLLKILVNAPEGRDGRLVRVPHESECAWSLRADLEASGCKRAELYADDEMRAPIVFHNLRHTCGVHMAVRRDAPQDIQWRLGHTTAAMTEKYIGEARYAAGTNFGTPFPDLPADLLRSAGEFRHGLGFSRVPPLDQDQIPAVRGASPTGFEESRKHDKTERNASKVTEMPLLAETIGPPSMTPDPKPPDDPDAALKNAIKAALDAGLYDRARALLEVLAKTSQAAEVVDLRDRRRE